MVGIIGGVGSLAEPSAKAAPKFCRDCRYRAEATGIDLSSKSAFHPEGECGHPSAQAEPDLVTGKAERWTMKQERFPQTIDTRFCGPHGRWWEPRDV